MWSKQLKIKAKFTKSERLCKWNRRIRLKRTVQSSLCVCVCVGACTHAYLFSGEDVSCQFDLGKVAFANGFQ